MADLFLFHHFNLRVQPFPCVQGVQDLQQFLFAQARSCLLYTSIEASGIAIACMTARYFNVPVVFAKKAKSKNIDGEVYTSKVQSFTYGREYDITLAKKFLNSGDRVLILDD